MISESLRLRVGDPVPRTSPFFDGQTIRIVAARGETVGFQVLHRTANAQLRLTLAAPGVATRSYTVEPAVAKRASSTGLFGKGHGAGMYPDILHRDDAPRSSPAYFEIVVARDAKLGKHRGELAIDSARAAADRTLSLELVIADVTLPQRPPRVWAYYDPRELVWAKLGTGTHDAPSEHERACIAMFGEHGVLLSPDLPITAWPARRELLGDFPYVPVKLLDRDPAKVGDEVRAWLAATQGSGKLPFTIPIDEPRRPDARKKVRELATAVRAAGGGARTFMYAVTAEPHPELGDAIDLYISLRARRGDAYPRWTYNGAPPRAGSFILDGESPGARTWGWIGHAWNIPVWYVWDALYWHDRHNRKGAPLPGRVLDHAHDATSFDDGEDHGNLDGVLALPGDDREPCRPTLRLASLRRGQHDRALIELAARCNADATKQLVAELVPRALGDVADRSAASWPRDDATWENARRKLIELAACNPSAAP